MRNIMANIIAQLLVYFEITFAVHNSVHRPIESSVVILFYVICKIHLYNFDPINSIKYYLRSVVDSLC